MSNPLVRKLERYVHLPEADRLCLAGSIGPERMVAARTDIIHEGDDPRAGLTAGECSRGLPK